MSEEIKGSEIASNQEFKHVSVMLEECMQYLDLKPNDIYVDATLGGAGHSQAAIQYLGSEGMLIGIDQDDVALAAAKKRLHACAGENPAEVCVLKGNFGNLDDLLVEAEVPYINAILFDLGVSSVQIDTPSRGFSFKENAPLDMRMNPSSQTLTAKEIVNTYSEEDLSRIIYAYSDEKWASRIAQFICKAREDFEISTSDELVEIIKAAVPASARRKGGHPAKRTFQALRIEVNSELDVLREGLEAAIRWLAPGGRIVVLSYHSLEDRIVKETFARHAQGCTCPPDFPVCVCGNKPLLKIQTKKPKLPSKTEIECNPRARSAKLRVAKRL